MKQVLAVQASRFRIPILLTLVVMAIAIPAGAQKNKNKKKGASNADAQATADALIPVPDSEAVDRAIGEMMGYWQIGDVDSMHKYFADDVVVVSGAWEPPVIGWDNYVKAYEAQRANVEGAHMDRTNTLIKVYGNFAWATYQFVYVAMADNKVVQFRGHTTLVLNKRADRWVITLNHSSVVDSTAPAPAATPAESAHPG
jgi:ketosteroid isomerase-like protein